jgi:protein O-mannosyl-transferase
MKSKQPKKMKRSAPAAVAVATTPQPRWWWYAAGVAVAFLAVLEIYWPAIHGPFLLDDTHLQYVLPGAEQARFADWLRGLRPLLMFTYWLNFQQSGSQDTFGYHLVNVLLHFFNGGLILLAVRNVLQRTGVARQLSWILSLFAAGLFLLHPLQTESVTYIASRSETFSVSWVLAAVVVFLYGVTDTLALSWLRVLAILTIFAAAMLTKEHTVVLPAVLLLTDYFWNPGFSFAGIRRNWKLYAPIFIGGVFGVRYVLRIIRYSGTAGFNLTGLRWYDYFYTECRVIWDYLRLFLLPFGQNLDPEVSFSHGVLDHGAIFGLAGLLAVSVLAWIYRRRFPLASYGWFIFLILLAPTSSFVPIRDPLAERRLYLPFIGLLFITVEFVRRWKIGRNTMIAALTVVLVAEGALTYQRNQLWASAIDIWKDTVSKSPNKARPRFQLAYAYYQAGQCSDAADQYQKTAQLNARPGHDLLLDWGLALDCAGNLPEALAKFQQAADREGNAHDYSQIGMEYGKMGKYPEALDALARAQKINPRFAMTYFYLGNIHSIQGNQQQAIADYQRVLKLDPGNPPALQALARLGAR